MSGQSKIIETILGDAEKQASEIVQKAETAAAEFIAKATKDAEQTASKLEAGSVQEAEEQKRRQLSVAQLEGRKAILSAKREVIDEAFDAAHEALKNLPETDYRKLMERLVLENAQGGDELLICDKDAALFTPEFVGELNSKLQAAGKSAVSLSFARADISGGLIFKSSAMERNCSLDSLLRMVRGEAEPKVAAILFD